MGTHMLVRSLCMSWSCLRTKGPCVAPGMGRRRRITFASSPSRDAQLLSTSNKGTLAILLILPLVFMFGNICHPHMPVRSMMIPKDQFLFLVAIAIQF